MEPSMDKSGSEDATEASTITSEKEVAQEEVGQKQPSHEFLIDRNLIQEIQHDEQDAELQSLGLSVYHQDELEQGILAQVDKVLEFQEKEEEKRRLDKQIKDVTENIRSTEQELSQNDVMLRVMRGVTVSVTKAMSARQERDRKQEQLTNLKVKQQELADKIAALDSDVKETEDAGPSTSGLLQKKEKEETEQERLIRLGEMTPFGTTLKKDSSDNVKQMTDFEKYLQSQAKFQKARVSKKQESKQQEEPVPSTSKQGLPSWKHNRKSPLKPSVLAPKKRKPKDALGTKTRKQLRGGLEPGSLASETHTMYLESDPDFIPESDEDEVEFIPQKVVKRKVTARKVKKQRPLASAGSGSDWCTDDSDWESSGDEARITKKRKKGHELDDGDEANYMARLRIWERNLKDEDKELHILEGGLEIPKSIWMKLFKYQQVGVQWMWELFENGTGGILGDEMGLGKTIQVIAFLAGLKASKLKDKHTAFRGLGPTLIVSPTTLMHQWVKELHVWWPPLRVAILHDSGSFGGSRATLIKDIARNHGILITSYQGLVKHQEALHRQSWHLVILDEGHKIRNPDAQATLAAKCIPTPHRIALTGSPMQNNLRELWSLFDFVYPSRLGTLPDFLANFAVPITQGGYANASEIQVATAYHCALSLKETIKPYLLRRMKNDVKNHIHLPGKNEQVLFCKLTDEQRSIYQQYVDSRLVRNIIEGKTQIFVGLITLRKICNHPDLFLTTSKLTQDDKSLPKEERYGHWERSGKMAVIHSLLKIWNKQGHRVLLFTQGRQMMCILENYVQQQGYKYLKLDGGTSISSRQPLINEFNNNPEHFIFLLTTRVGGLGVNLTGANRVVIFDPDWNPATDCQARERAWRIGQEKQVTIYRLITAGTIEEKIYHRQIFKQFLTNKVLKDPRQRRFFKSNDLYELFTLKEGEANSTETSAIFAGTGSEIKMKPKKRISPSPQAINPLKIQFSQKKIIFMKQLAHKLSQQIASKHANKTVASTSQSSEVKSESISGTAATSCTEEPTNPSEGSAKEADTSSSSALINNNPSLKCCDASLKEKLASRKKKKAQSAYKQDASVYGECSTSRAHEQPAKKRKRKQKDKKHKRKGAKFEGERVSHLVKYGNFADLLKKSGIGAQETEKNESQDDYVLRKLFKKSGLQTALKHDNIMNGGGADVALVEREARNVAQEAVARLKESQRQCFNAHTGIPTWTGNHGHRKPPGLPAEKKKEKPKPSAALGKAPEPENVNELEKKNEELITGEDLVALWGKRNRLLHGASSNRPLSPDLPPSPDPVNLPDDDDIFEDSEDDAAINVVPNPPDHEAQFVPLPRPIPPPPRVRTLQLRRNAIFVTPRETELLTVIRSFLAFGGTVNGQASTAEILERFPNTDLSPEMTPIFKCMLESISEFYRNEGGVGIWKLKPEFR